jgi:hypothetical protein
MGGSRVPGQPGLYIKTLSQRVKNKTNKTNKTQQMVLEKFKE